MELQKGGRAPHLLLLLALGLLFGGVWDGDVQRSPQRRRVAAAEGGLETPQVGSSGRGTTSGETSSSRLTSGTHLQQSLQLLHLLREEVGDQLFRLCGDSERTHTRVGSEPPQTDPTNTNYLLGEI